MRKVLIAQARFRSTRLPGKILYPIAGRSMLDHVVERMRRVALADDIVVATSNEPADDIIAEWCRELQVAWFRGHEHDVLDRFLAAAAFYHADVVVRVCADAPLLDPQLIDRAIEFYLERADRVDYISNMLTRTFPRGQSVEVMAVGVLAALDRQAREPHQREHVTPYLLENPDRFRVDEFVRSPDLSHMNWTVDTHDDLNFVRDVYAELYRPGRIFGMDAVLELLENDPQLARRGEMPK